MKLSKKRLIMVLATVLIIGVIGGVLYSIAKYTTTVEGQVEASVAKWVFDISGTDTYSVKDTLNNLTLAETCDEKTLIDKKIAPGTSGAFEIVIDTTGTEVGMDYVVSFENATGHKLPANLKMYHDGKEWTFEQGLSGRIDANSADKIIIHDINWIWEYNTTNGDNADTLDGQNSFDYTFNATITGTQVNPISK